MGNRILIQTENKDGNPVEFEAKWDYKGDTLEALKKAYTFLGLVIEDFGE